MKKYRTQRWDEGITVVEVLRESEKCVWLKSSWREPVREKKASTYTVYFDTWKDARAMLVGRAERRYLAAQKNLEAMRLELMDANALPDDEPEATR